jgi:hypothetical protein
MEELRSIEAFCLEFQIGVQLQSRLSSTWIMCRLRDTLILIVSRPHQITRTCYDRELG